MPCHSEPFDKLRVHSVRDPGEGSSQAAYPQHTPYSQAGGAGGSSTIVVISQSSPWRCNV
jgi:hypothetical protein